MKVVTCECGEIVRADKDDDLVRQVEAHVEELNEHLKLIYYKIEFYQKIMSEKELEKV